MNTRKYPRTMQEAFGPYTSYELSEQAQPMDKMDVIVCVACALAAVAVAVFSYLGWV